MALTAEQVAQKWGRNFGGSRQSYIDGINAVTESPTARAAARAEHWQQQVSSSDALSRYRAGLNRVTLQQWKAAAVEVGAARLTAGAERGQMKMAAFMREFLPFLRQNLATLNAETPRGDFEQNLRRMERMARLNRGFRRELVGGRIPGALTGQ